MSLLKEYQHLIDTEQFFEAHECLEEAWRKSEGKEKLFYHRLILIAASMHHKKKGNMLGYINCVERARAKADAILKKPK